MKIETCLHEVRLIRGVAPRTTVRALVAGAFCLGLAACVTAPKNPMSMAQRDAMGVDRINVVIVPETNIWWGEAERDFAASKGCEQKTQDNTNMDDPAAATNPASDCDYEALIATPEARAYLEDRARTVLSEAMETRVKPAFDGPSPTTLRVEVTQVHIVSGGQAMLIGGAHTLRADLIVVDNASGETLARYDELSTQAGYAPGGILSLVVEAASSDPYERLADGYADAAKKWLGQEEQG